MRVFCLCAWYYMRGSSIEERSGEEINDLRTYFVFGEFRAGSANHSQYVLHDRSYA